MGCSHSTPTSTTLQARSVSVRRVQKPLLVWVSSKGDTRHILETLRTFTNDVTFFTQLEDCFKFLEELESQKALVVISNTFADTLIPRIHSMPSLNAIYLLSTDPISSERWTKNWSKVKGTYTNIQPIAGSLQRIFSRTNPTDTPISFVEAHETTIKIDLNRLEPTFMYTQIFKKILLEMNHCEQERQTFVQFCREKFVDDSTELSVIDEFNRTYQSNNAVQWYTRECFIYKMLNRSLRLLEGSIIVNMGFFIYDLHRQLEQLHRAQNSSYDGKPFIVYRGQGISENDFHRLQKSEGGLLAFNSFLSTSTEKSNSLVFAEMAMKNPTMVGILFVMSIDSTQASTPFAQIDNISYFHDEAEILFSMHTVFRVVAIRSMNKNNRLFEVELRLTSDDDPKLQMLSSKIEEQVGGGVGWARLGYLLITLRQTDKAEELYLALVDQTPNEKGKETFYHQLGLIKDEQGNYEKAIEYYEKSLAIKKENLHANHPDLAVSYNNIGVVYKNMGKYKKALSYFKKDLEISEKNLPPDHPDLAASYNNIGMVYNNMGEYPNALSHYEKALKIRQKTLPTNHPDLATSYNNIASIYDKLQENSKAVSYYQKALQIYQTTLPATHPDLAILYNNIGFVYSNMSEYTNALSHYEAALRIFQNTLSADHPDLATSYNNIGYIYSHMNEYSKALSYHEKALAIRQKSLPENHPDLAASYNNIGLMYYHMEEYSKALPFLKHAQSIWKHALPSNHPQLETVRQSIEIATKKLSKKFFALSIER